MPTPIGSIKAVVATVPPVASKPFPDITYLCLDLPLYTEVALEQPHQSDVARFIQSRRRLECFCEGCKEKSIFHNEESDALIPHTALFDRDIFLQFSCARVQKHQLSFWFRIRNEKLFKVGQHPSHADLAEGDLSKYRKLLGDDAKEFSRAIGLSAHGVGIGAFVYLRRIIEHLVEETHVKAANDGEWDEATYEKLRSVDKSKEPRSKLRGIDYRKASSN